MSAYSDSDFEIEFYEQGEQIQADLYRVRGAEPSYDLIDEITIGLVGEFGPGSLDHILTSWEKQAEAKFTRLDWLQPSEPIIVPIGEPYRGPLRKKIYTVSVQVSYDFLESVR